MNKFGKYFLLTTGFAFLAAFARIPGAITKVHAAAHAGEIQFTPLSDPNARPSTEGNVINDLGVAAGIYEGGADVYYGFVSTPPYSNESFTTVAAAGIPHTGIWGINLEGTITGNSLDASGVYHGTVSHPPYSTVTLFDAPGACTSASPVCLGTSAWNINLEGVIAGYYTDADGVNHGYVTHPPYTESTFTTIDAPGACSSGPGCSGLGTIIFYFSLNDFGVVTGYFLDANQVPHGYVTHPPYTESTFTTFDAPGACSSGPACAFEGTTPESINLFGVITGTYYDAEGVGHGFVTYPPYTNTTFTSFDAAGSIDTLPSSINAEGVVVGFFSDAAGVNHGFVSHPPYTTVTSFDAPHACSSDSNPACSGKGTFAYGINVEGMFTGGAKDASGHGHGFVAQQ